MKPEKLEKISHEKYFVKDNCTYVRESKNSEKLLCNFYIKSLVVNCSLRTPRSFTVKLVSKKGKKKEATIPYHFMSNPYDWLLYEFERKVFKACIEKRQFNKHMLNIIENMDMKSKIEDNEQIVGWTGEWIEYDKGLFDKTKVYSFNRVEDPFDAIDYDAFNRCNKPNNNILKYMELADTNISIPLFSFMLLALLNEFQLPGNGVKPDFIMAITGSTAEIRRKTALFFTNLYERDSTFKENEYKKFHITPKDQGSEARMKAEYAKDCTLIAFEPSKRQLNFLLNKIYNSNVITDEHAVNSLCVVTREHINDIKADNIINVRLDKSFNMNSVTDYFKSSDRLLNIEDELTESIYYYISCLANHMFRNNDNYYIQSEFEKFSYDFEEKHDRSYCSEKAYEATMLLLFAFKLFVETFEKEKLEHELYKKAYDAISRVAEDSFPLGGVPTYTDFDNAKKLCREIDAYFSKDQKQKQITQLGLDKEPYDPWLWFDNDYFYIIGARITDILKMQNSNLKLSTAIKKVLYKKNLIKGYAKDGGNVEYVVHYQKPLYSNLKTKKRFIAFNRKTCKEYHLFEFVEKTCKEQENHELAERLHNVLSLET